MGASRLSPADKMYMTLNYAALLLFCATALYPFIYFLALSFNDGYDAMKGESIFSPECLH